MFEDVAVVEIQTRVVRERNLDSHRLRVVHHAAHAAHAARDVGQLRRMRASPGPARSASSTSESVTMTGRRKTATRSPSDGPPAHQTEQFAPGHYPGTPAFLRIAIIGHHPLKAD